MKHKHNEGFTLVELLVTIVVASIVTLAASTVLLLGIRLNKSSSDTAQQQNTVRIFLSVVEKMATEGTIEEVANEPGTWSVTGSGDKTLFHYDSNSGIIYSGDTPMMEEVTDSFVTVIDNLLVVSVETEDGSYTTSVYCRNGAILADGAEENITKPEENLPEDESMSAAEREARAEFLKILLSQRGSTGMILKEINGTMTKTPVYYAEWCDPSWPITTAWCGCFITWGMDQVSIGYLPDGWKRDFAYVDKFKDFFTPQGEAWQTDITKATPGDIIFFDWDVRDADTTPNHVGVVLAVKDGYIYTIEGNSANMVAVRKYPITDSRIMGYGILDWKSE